MPLMELNNEQVSWAKQTAKGSPASAATKRGRKVGGNISAAPSDGSENWSDGSRLSSAVAFAESISGTGEPVFQLQPGVFGSLAYLWAGQDSATGTATNCVQTLTVGAGPTSGTAILNFEGQLTSPLPYNATSAQVQTALENLSKIGKGNVTCGGGPWPGTPITVTFVVEMAASPQTLLTATDTFAPSGDVTPTMTTPGVPVTHTITPASTGFWASFWKQVGSSVSVKERYADCRVGGLTVQMGRDQMVGRVTPQVFSLDPGEVVASLPVQAEDVDRPFVWTEASGSLELDGVVFSGGLLGFQLALTDSLTPQYAQGVTAYDVAAGVGSVTLSNLSILLDAAGLVRFNRLIYGVDSPSAGAKPSTAAPPRGSFKANLWRFNTSAAPGRQIQLDLPNVQWSREGLEIAGNPDGGVAQITMQGTTVKVGAAEHVTTTVKNADAAYT